MTPLQLFVAVGAATSIFLIAFSFASRPRTDRVQARLTQLGTPQAQNLEALELQDTFFERALRPFATRLATVMSRSVSSSFMTRTGQRLALAGYPGEMTVGDWLSMKVIMAGILAGILSILFFVLGGGLVTALLIGAAALGIGYIGPEFWLSSRIRRRQTQILRMIPDSLDLLTISVRAGLGFDAALAKVVEKVDGPLSDEFRRALAEIRLGKSRREALRAINARTEVRALGNFIGAIVQAEQLGVPIAKVLQVQSEQLRIDRRQRAERLAAQAPIKMLFPLVGCIFPSLFIVILGPAIILIATTLGSAT